ncbi:MAG: hypothetical protein WC869_04425 [Phycisphaerae bacterium]|jgi:hypothetical protein
MSHPRLVQYLMTAVAAALLAGAGWLGPQLLSRNVKYELIPIIDSVGKNQGLASMLAVVPGGLRVLLVNYLWIQAEDLKNKGRTYDAGQKAAMICRLMPQFAGVWDFQAWNMAWNRSAETHTAEERWLWICNGMRLLRDEAIPLNPRSLVLYKGLGWLFFSKMGQNLDEMHNVYKQKWAAEMQHLLGAPPVEGTTEVIDAFRPIAEAPLDKNPGRQAAELIQGDQLAILMKDERVARYVKQLAEQGIAIDRSLLEAYNRFSREANAEVVRFLPARLENDHDKAVSDLINSAEFAPARAKLMAFVRAQILWNEYRMDPSWMLGLMVKYDAPLDWRLVWPHAMYWTSKGLNVCNNVPLDRAESLNTDRTFFHSLANLFAFGRMSYIENPQKSDAPAIGFHSDWRYIDATHKAYLELVPAIAAAGKEKVEDSVMKSGHINFLIYAIQTLYVNYQREKAQYYLDWIRDYYKMKGDNWDLDLKDFVIAELNRDGAPSSDISQSQITTALMMANYFLASGQKDKSADLFSYARKVWEIHDKSSEYSRLKFPPFRNIFSDLTLQMLLEPRATGYYMPLLNRVQLYSRLDDQTRVMLYDRLINAGILQQQCAAEGLNFQQAFPPPPGLEQYRASERDRLKLNPSNPYGVGGKPG